jgi:hypothetical protein
MNSASELDYPDEELPAFHANMVRNSAKTAHRPQNAEDKPPFQFTIQNKNRALLAYTEAEFGPGVNTNLNAIEKYAVILKGLVRLIEQTELLDLQRVELAREIALRSLTERDFNDRYHSMYKYIKQCCWSTHWTPPDEFPFSHDGIYGIKSWKALKKFFSKIKKPIMTPEITIPDTCLFPWDEEKPQAIEILLEDHKENELEMDIIEEILDELLIWNGAEHTMLDFALSQTSTNKVCKYEDIDTAYRAAKDKKPLTQVKYVGVTEWIDKGQPLYKHKDYAIRTPVWKRVTEYRDAITLPAHTLYKVWDFNQTLKNCMSHIPEVGDYTDPSDLLSIRKKFSYYLHCDWKKSGLTLPHWFAESVILTLKKKGIVSGLDFPTKGWPILDPASGKIFTPSGFGYGLGMVNNLYTLFNIVLYKYCIKKEIIEGEHQMLSFNDDMIIGSETKLYYQFLGVCSKSGAYPDNSKWYETDQSCQFLEIYQGGPYLTAHKWLGFANTALATFAKAVNYDHFRFYLSSVYDANALHVDYSRNANQINSHFWEELDDLLKKFHFSCWGIEINNSIPPALGGVAWGSKHRTRYYLKKDLLLLEDEPDTLKRVKMWTNFKAHTEFLSEGLQYASWKKFPEGKTKDYFQQMGKYASLDPVFASMRDKTENKFVTERDSFTEKYWEKYTKYLDIETKVPKASVDYWQWAKSREWPNMAIPKEFVLSSDPDEGDTIYFIRIQKEEYKYSMPVNISSYLDRALGRTPLIPIEDLTIGRRQELQVPFKPQKGVYEPYVNFDTLSKISSFNYPKRIFMDYWSRTRTFIQELGTKNFKAEAAMKLFQLANPDYDGPATKATWYTRVPVPYEDWMERYLNYATPDMHPELIITLTTMPNYLRNIDLEYQLGNATFQKWEAENQEFANLHKRSPNPDANTPALQVVNEDLSISGNGEEARDAYAQEYFSNVQQTLNTILLRYGVKEEEEPPPTWTVDTSNILAGFNIPDGNGDSDSDDNPEYVYNDEPDSDDEARLIQMALDSDDRNWDDHDWNLQD